MKKQLFKWLVNSVLFGGIFIIIYNFLIETSWDFAGFDFTSKFLTYFIVVGSLISLIISLFVVIRLNKSNLFQNNNLSVVPSLDEKIKKSSFKKEVIREKWQRRTIRNVNPKQFFISDEMTKKDKVSND